ncbi:MAG: AzlC family ABC transporter permease, partial [Salaquimonas sp.]
MSVDEGPLAEIIPDDNAVRNSDRLAGVRDVLPLILPIAAFGTMFGAASSAAGHSVAMTVWSSVALFAGASQFVFLEVYGLGVPVWSVMLAVFAVNFRHILYSAAVTNKISRYSFWQKTAALFLLTDLQFASIENRYNNQTGAKWVSPSYYFAFGLPCYFLWIIATFLGALSGKLINDPAVIGLDFVLPIY